MPAGGAPTAERAAASGGSAAASAAPGGHLTGPAPRGHSAFSASDRQSAAPAAASVPVTLDARPGEPPALS